MINHENVYVLCFTDMYCFASSKNTPSTHLLAQYPRISARKIPKKGIKSSLYDKTFAFKVWHSLKNGLYEVKEMVLRSGLGGQSVIYAFYKKSKRFL